MCGPAALLHMPLLFSPTSFLTSHKGHTEPADLHFGNLNATKVQPQCFMTSYALT